MLNSWSDFNETYSHINTHDTQQDDVFFPFTHLAASCQYLWRDKSKHLSSTKDLIPLQPP